jgi:putative nucleotidyltransferase with HDIG domain
LKNDCLCLNLTGRSVLAQNNMEKIRKLLDKVEVLPLSPALLPKLLSKLSDVDTNFDEVVEIIAFDPALTSKLLQICNSAYFGQESEVNSVAEAVSRVGYQSVYLLVAMINGSNCFPWPSPPGVDAAKLWRHSITTAFNAKFVAESAGTDGNLLFTAGLLHDIGKVILGQEEAPPSAGLFRGRRMPPRWSGKKRSLAARIPKWGRRCWNAGNCPRNSPSPCVITTIPRPRRALSALPPA